MSQILTHQQDCYKAEAAKSHASPTHFRLSFSQCIGFVANLWETERWQRIYFNHVHKIPSLENILIHRVDVYSYDKGILYGGALQNEKSQLAERFLSIESFYKEKGKYFNRIHTLFLSKILSQELPPCVCTPRPQSA